MLRQDHNQWSGEVVQVYWVHKRENPFLAIFAEVVVGRLPHISHCAGDHTSSENNRNILTQLSQNLSSNIKLKLNIYPVEKKKYNLFNLTNLKLTSHQNNRNKFVTSHVPVPQKLESPRSGPHKILNLHVSVHENSNLYVSISNKFELYVPIRNFFESPRSRSQQRSS